jgi:hypothetical protein
VEIRNPLQIPLQFTNLRLSGVYTPESADEQVVDTEPAFNVVPIDVVLGPKETQKVSLYHTINCNCVYFCSFDFLSSLSRREF